jgi:hypothetical protein
LRLATLCVWFALATTARADELAIADCAGASAQAITKLVQLELASQDLHARGVSLQCEGTQAQIAVRDANDVTQALTLSLDDTQPEARARLLALTIAELVATHQLEEPAASVAVQAPVPPRVERRASLWLGAGVSRQASLWLPTIHAGAGYDWGRVVAEADLRFDWRTVDGPRASTRARVLSLSLAPLHALRRGRTMLALGAGLRVGWAQLEAVAREEALVGRTLHGVYVAPIARGVLALALSDRWSTRLDLELGYVLRGLRGLDAEGASLLKLEGLRSSATLALALAL